MKSKRFKKLPEKTSDLPSEMIDKLSRIDLPLKAILELCFSFTKNLDIFQSK